MQNTLTVNDLFSKYLTWCGHNRSERTLEWYTGHIEGFLAHLRGSADMEATNLKPFHIAEWIDSKPKWGPTYKGGAIVAVKRVYNWAEEMGYVETSPIKKIKKPTANRRESYMKPEDYDRLLDLLPQDDPFRTLITFVWYTGCRPQEARAIERRHVDLERERIVFPKEESKGKRHSRIIYLHGPALIIIQQLMAEIKEGKLFRNSRADAWTKYAVCNRMQRLSEKTGVKLAAYDARHGFATRKLGQGHDHLTIAALMGHRDGSMLAKVYSHIDKDEVHLKKALAD